jgi:hypothetical protein
MGSVSGIRKLASWPTSAQAGGFLSAGAAPGGSGDRWRVIRSERWVLKTEGVALHASRYALVRDPSADSITACENATG